MERIGIDVSAWQGNINWNRVQNDKIKFAMIRSSFGITGVDDFFAKNMQEISTTSIYRGAYHYCYAKSIREAEIEAKHFLKIINPYSFNYPVAVAIKDKSLESLGKKNLTDITAKFCRIIQDAGYYICIFSNLNFLNNLLDMDTLKIYDIWLEEWEVEPTYTGAFGIWQYTQRGSISGVNGEVNMDKSYRDYEMIINQAGLNNTSSFGQGQNTDKIQETGIAFYTVIPGDSLWNIAEKFLGSGYNYNQIVVLNGLTSDVINPGQILKIPLKEPANMYTVVKGDTLWSIAKRFLNSGQKYTLIMSANNLVNDLIREGQILIIPKEIS